MKVRNFVFSVILLMGTNVFAGDWKGKELQLIENKSIQEMYRLHCTHRKNNGLRPQKLNTELTRAAQEWAEYMADHGYFEHSHYPVAENIAVGANTASGAISMWINSRGHNANLLSGGQQVGFGLAKTANGTWYFCSCHGSGFKSHRE
jgi:uncharacterized protein YkwD